MKILFVMGMHRCGTSVLTSYIETLGYSLGKNINQDKNWQNPKGYWENDTLTQFHNKLLRFNKFDWSNVSKINLKYTKNHVDEYCRLILEQFNTDKIVIKDPRLSFFTDFLLEVSKKLTAEIKIIFALRDKEECIISLNKAQNLDIKKCKQLFDITMKCYKEYMLKVNYNDFVNNNKQLRYNICNFLNEKDSNIDKIDIKLYRNIKYQ